MSDLRAPRFGGEGLICAYRGTPASGLRPCTPRDRAAVAQEGLTSRLSGQMNRTMYVLSLVATLFLPLGFVTGLFGVNLAGMPGTEADGAFVWLVLALALLTAVQVVFFWLRRWL